MVTFILAHLLGGVLLGARYRFAILLPAFVFVAVEAVYAAVYPLFWPWYVILIVGIGLVQIGYVIASVLRPRREEKPAPAARPSVSATE